MENYKKFINNWLKDIETNVACEMEINNLDLRAKNELIYKKPIQLNIKLIAKTF